VNAATVARLRRSSPSAMLLFAQSEREYQDKIVEYARLMGWLINHQLPALRADGRWRTAVQGHRGFLDLTLVRPPRLVVLEIKAELGRLTSYERRWLAAWQQVPCAEAHVVRPSTWPFVERLLARESPEEDHPPQ
jgi:hypothetical protein